MADHDCAADPTATRCSICGAARVPEPVLSPVIYFAASLFSEAEKEWNARTTQRLELETHSTVFLPQRDGELLAQLVAEGVRIDLARSIIRNRDLDAIDKSDLIITVLDGAVADPGAIYELAAATFRELPARPAKELWGLRTDGRQPLPSGENPMLYFDEFFTSTDALVKALRWRNKVPGAVDPVVRVESQRHHFVGERCIRCGCSMGRQGWSGLCDGNNPEVKP